jgi:hypothetical protein
MSDSFQKQVWDKFKSLEVKLEKKGKFNYASWSDMMTVLMGSYPESDYKFWYEPFDDGTVMTYCDLAIRQGEKVWKRFMWLPVMDVRNNAIQNPTTRQVSDTYMRCFVKALATAGLGLYVYRGEDIPKEEERPATEEELMYAMSKMEQTETDYDKVLKHFKINDINELSYSQYHELMQMLIAKEEKNAARS